MGIKSSKNIDTFSYDNFSEISLCFKDQMFTNCGSGVEVNSFEELKTRRVIKWKSSHVVTFMKKLGIGEFKDNLQIYSGKHILDNEFFNDDPESMKNITKNLVGKDPVQSSEKFFSALRALRFYTEKNVPEIFLCVEAVRVFLVEKDLEYLYQEVEEKGLNFAYLLERTEEELLNVFKRSDSSFGKILYNSITEWAPKFVSEKYMMYRRAIKKSKSNRCFGTVDLILGGANLDNLKVIGSVGDDKKYVHEENREDNVESRRDNVAKSVTVQRTRVL